MTSGELVTYQQPAAAVDSWVPVVTPVVQLAQHVADTEFVPKALRGHPAAIAAAILAGREAGIGPMTALQHLHMVDGRPSLSAERKRAQALAAGHDIVYVETTTTRCVVKGRRRGSTEWSTVVWSLEDARRANLAGRDNWRRHPRRMLQARATSELCDMLFPDATAGLPTTEDLIDTDTVGITTDGQATPGKKRARRARVPAGGPTTDDPPVEQHQGGPPPPPLPGEETDTAGGDTLDHGQDDDDQGAGVTQAQLRKLHPLFAAAGIGKDDRGERLRVASVVVGRELTSSSDLTRDEAGALIDTLSHITNQDDPAAALTELIDRVQNAETTTENQGGEG